MLLRLALPLIVFAVFTVAVWVYQAHAERRCEAPAADPEQPAERPTEPPEDALLAA